jgi:hypothetical protein
MTGEKSSHPEAPGGQAFIRLWGRVNKMRKLVYFIAAVFVFIFGVEANSAQGIQDPILRDQRFLQAAINKGDTGSMEIYLQRGYVKINTECVAPCSGMATWLEWACFYGANVDSLEYLLTHGADILYVDSRGSNALRACLTTAGQGTAEVRRDFLRHLDARVEKAKDKHKVIREQLTAASLGLGDGELYNFALGKGNDSDCLEIAKWLFANGADIKALPQRYGPSFKNYRPQWTRDSPACMAWIDEKLANSN